jgi:hypothetical protein
LAARLVLLHSRAWLRAEDIHVVLSTALLHRREWSTETEGREVPRGSHVEPPRQTRKIGRSL